MGEGGSSRVNFGCGIGSARGERDSLSSTVYVWFNLLGDTIGVYPRLGELPGVAGRLAEGGELGVDGRRKGDALCPPKDSGEGLKVGLFAFGFVSQYHYFDFPLGPTIVD